MKSHIGTDSDTTLNKNVKDNHISQVWYWKFQASKIYGKQINARQFIELNILLAGYCYMKETFKYIAFFGSKEMR